MNRCIIAVPIYKDRFDYDEYHSVKQLFKILGHKGYDIIAFCPMSLDVSYYNEFFDFTNFYRFYDDYFNNYPNGYNSLLLNSGFYEYFSEYEYLFIYQPDCWIFRDELEYWCDQGYDFIGAPQVYNMQDSYWIAKNTGIGNGGFSLRKISTWIDICKRYAIIANNISNGNDTMFGEDHFISEIRKYGVGNDIKLPKYADAIKFSFETNPHILYIMNDHKLPFGCHAYNKIIDKRFWEKFICYKKKAYSVVTYLFGDYDILRDPDEVDETAEYICITDRDDLESNVWQFKKLNYPNTDSYSPWQKSLIARYTCLDYISTDICFKIDASVHLKKSPRDYILRIYITDNIECGILLHPWRDSYLDEFDEWIGKRGLDHTQKEQFMEFCNKNGFDYNERGMIMTTVMTQRNDHFNRELNNMVLSELMSNNDFNQRVDQAYFSIIFGNRFYFSNYAFIFYSMQVLDSDYLEYFYHGTDYTHANEYKYDSNAIDTKYFCNVETKCEYWI